MYVFESLVPLFKRLRYDNTQILILAEATLRFVLKVFSVLRRWRARYSVPSGCLGRTVVQNLTPDVAFLTVRLCSLITVVEIFLWNNSSEMEEVLFI